MAEYDTTDLDQQVTQKERENVRRWMLIVI